MRGNATACRGIRGATTVPDGDPESIAGATRELLRRIVEANGCRLEDVAAVVFTLTEDLEGAAPGAAARADGWDQVPLLVVREHGGASLIPRCLRVMVLWNTTVPQDGIRHVYLGEAARLRPDLQLI